MTIRKVNPNEQFGSEKKKKGKQARWNSIKSVFTPGKKNIYNDALLLCIYSLFFFRLCGFALIEPRIAVGDSLVD